MEEYLTRIEHIEFAKRVEEENARQNHRILKLEQCFDHLNRLTIAVERMAVSMDNMSDKQDDMADRLRDLEKEPADRWRQLKSGIIGAIAAAIGAAIIAALFHYV